MAEQEQNTGSPKTKLSVDARHKNSGADDMFVFVRKRGSSRHLIKYRLKPGHDKRERYGKHWNVERVKRLAVLQGVLNLLLYFGSMVTSGRAYWDFEQLEYTGFGVWASIHCVLGTVILVQTFEKATYAKLHLTMGFEIVSSIAWLALVVAVICIAIPSRMIHRGRYLSFRGSPAYGDVSPFETTALVLVVIMALVGAAQFGISFYLAFSSGRAIYQGPVKLEGKLYALRLVQDDDEDLNDDELAEKQKDGKVTSQDELASACEEQSKV